MSSSTYDVSSKPFKAWLRSRLKQAKRDTVDTLAKKLLADTRIPAQGSKSLYTAQLRAKGYSQEDQETLKQAWQEMRDQDTSE